MSVIKSYSQNREDIYIDWLLDGKKSGFYVDVGANDPDIDSVTKFFYEKGWRGVHVEPIERLAKSLKEKRPGDIVVQAGVGLSGEPLMFQEYEGADGLSSFSKDIQKQNTKRKKKEYTVDVRTLKDILTDILNKPSQKIDFMKIDVEGYEYEVIKSNDWEKYRPTLLIIEANHVMHDWRPFIEKQGYSKVFFDGLNEYYTIDKRMIKSAIDRYPEYLIGPTVFNQQQIDHMDYEVSVSKRAQDDVISDREAEIALLNEQLTNIRLLTKNLVKLIKVKVDSRAANPVVQRRSLYYQNDQNLKALISKGVPPEALLEYTRKHDSKNVQIKKTPWGFSAKLTRIFWVIASKGLALMIRILKKLSHRGSR